MPLKHIFFYCQELNAYFFMLKFMSLSVVCLYRSTVLFLFQELYLTNVIAVHYTSNGRGTLKA